MRWVLRRGGDVVTGVMGGVDSCTEYSATNNLTWDPYLNLSSLISETQKFTHSSFEKELVLTCERFAPT